MKIREQKRQSHAGCQMTIWNKAPKVSKRNKNIESWKETKNWSMTAWNQSKEPAGVDGWTILARAWIYIYNLLNAKIFYFYFFFFRYDDGKAPKYTGKHFTIPSSVSTRDQKVLLFFFSPKNLFLEIYLVDCVHRHTQQLRLSAVVVIWTIPSVSLTREAGPVDSHRNARPPSRHFFIQLIQHLTNENS